MKIILIVLLHLFFGTSLMAKGESIPPYEISCNGVGVEGTYLVEVAVILPKPNADVEGNIRRAAIHGVLFKGVSASEQCSGYRPIVTKEGIEQEYSSFFSSFFKDDCKIASYANIVEGSLHVIKIPKKNYRISAIVSVKKDNLRNMLESNKVIEGLKDLF